MKRYYIGGRQYVPEKSTELCAYDGIMGKAALYRTAKGAFFIVDESGGDGVGDASGNGAGHMRWNTAWILYMNVSPGCPGRWQNS